MHQLPAHAPAPRGVGPDVPRRGLVIVGVHTPEFAFEAVPSNVRAAIKRLGIRYPVALDPKYGTWNQLRQPVLAGGVPDRPAGARPLRALRRGRLRRAARRTSARCSARSRPSPASDRLPRLTPTGSLTPESYLGSARLDRYAGSSSTRTRRRRTPSRRRSARTTSPTPALEARARSGSSPVADARLRLHFHARKVYLVLGGTGTVQVLVDGKPERTVPVTADRLYTLVDRPRVDDALLELRFSPGRRGVRLHVRLGASARRTGRCRAPRSPRARAGSASSSAASDSPDGRSLSSSSSARRSSSSTYAAVSSSRRSPR